MEDSGPSDKNYRGDWSDLSSPTVNHKILMLVIIAACAADTVSYNLVKSYPVMANYFSWPW